ncbi:ATP-dependent RNA helicase Dbp7p [Monosporozyma unispora]|nr:ATP-dependent RNA helicase dbp7 [Kazachstania unispora]
MDDDGMILNFVTGDDAGAQTSNKKITGGRWKDRRKVRNEMIRKEPNNKRPVREENISKEDQVEIETFESHQSKKQKPNHNNNPSGFVGNRKTKDLDNKISRDKGQTTLPQASEQIVTSLFSSSREIETSVNTNAHDETAVVNPSNAPLAGDNFESFGTHPTLVTHLEEKMRISKPTSIQKLVVPHLMSNLNDNDLFIHAQTGSGKTLAFLLPVLSTLLNMKERIDRTSGAFSLIIAPTRELASQIYQVCLTLTQCCHYLVPCLLIGGERKKSEKARLRKGCNFIIGTPGRILDHLQNTKVIREQLAASLRYVILDEGDKLMELGFEETLTDILKIIHEIPLNPKKFPSLPSRIIHVLCSATTTGSVTKLGNVALKNYRLLSNCKNKKDKSASDLSVAPDQLKQMVTIVPPKLRLVTLGGILSDITKKVQAEDKKDETTRTMVFLSCSDSVEFHFEAFTNMDSACRKLVADSVKQLTRGSTVFPCFDNESDPNVVFYKLHGSLSQQMRSATLKHFATNNDATKGKHLIMFCTDVASRGLDLPHVGTVIEFDPPFSVEDHLHRVGRTARAGRSGDSILFLLPGEEEGYLEHIKPYHPLGWKLLKFDQDILKPAFTSMHVERNDKKQFKDKKKEDVEWDTNATTWHLNIERRILEDDGFKSVAVKGYSSHIRAYTTHISSEKVYFNVRCLHLGHLAKSFGLRERPRAMNAQSKKGANDDPTRRKPKKENPKNVMFSRARLMAKEGASEFNY